MRISMKESFKQAPAEVTELPRIVANNTFQYIDRDGFLVTRLHLTDIIKQKGKDIILNSGGWKTVTTKDRLNVFSPAAIFSDKGTWFVSYKGQTVPFYDGINLAKMQNKSGELKSQKKLKAEIKKFADLYDLKNLPEPDSGDCWHCSMFYRITEPGQRYEDTQHLLDHIKEGYAHGALLVNALRWGGWSDTAIGLAYAGHGTWNLKKTVRRYLQAQLGLTY